MKLIIRILVTAAALAVAAWVVPGIHTQQWSAHAAHPVTNAAQLAGTLVVVAIIFGIVNALLKPIIKVVGCGFYVLTLGLFAIVVNGALLYLASWIVYDHLHLPFHVTSFMSAVWGALIVGIVSWLIHLVLGDERKASR